MSETVATAAVTVTTPYSKVTTRRRDCRARIRIADEWIRGSWRNATNNCIETFEVTLCWFPDGKSMNKIKYVEFTLDVKRARDAVSREYEKRSRLFGLCSMQIGHRLQMTKGTCIDRHSLHGTGIH